jgi:hypothetical protein
VEWVGWWLRREESMERGMEKADIVGETLPGFGRGWGLSGELEGSGVGGLMGCWMGTGE